MWYADILADDERKLTFQIRSDERDIPLDHHTFLTLLASSFSFRGWYNQWLASSDFEAFLWENRPVASDNLNEPYECTLVRNQYLAGKKPDPEPFSQYFDHQKSVVTFPNLGGDAKLVAPCPRGPQAGYTHLGRFVRQCPEEQIQDFWRITADEMMTRIGSEPRWLSTSGLGVFWLHARIDSRPKYYQTEAYKRL
ncbi:MAG: hypothetical protein R3281_12740 [Balneolaceae bacterium]|nr:hypothetical protein [Balneolaceae bacterium]